MRQIDFCYGAEQTLDSMMGSLRIGNGVDFASVLLPFGLTELGKELKREKIRDSIFDRCNLSTLDEPLRSLEILKSWKHWGSTSRTPPFTIDQTSGDSLEKQVQAYFNPTRQRCVIDNDAMLYAVGIVRSLIPFGSLRPIDLRDAASLFDRSGMGFPVMSSEVGFEHVLSLSKEVWDSGANLRWVRELPAVAGRRGQPRGRKHPTDPRPQWFSKTRLIYMMPRVTANLEKTIQKPLQDVLSLLPQFCAWRNSHDVDVEMTRLLQEGSRVLSVDFKGYDQSVPFEVIDIVFDIIRGWFVGEASELVEWCREAFKRTGIITPGIEKGSRVYYPGESRSGGVPSGSVNTNLIDTLVNILVMHYAAHVCKTRVRSYYPQGDDGAYSFTRSVTLEALSECVSTHFGMTLSPDKTYYEYGQVHFLQNLHVDGYVINGLNVGVRPIMHMGSTMTSYERVDVRDWVRSYDSIRWLQQIGQCLHHPRCSEMCDWLLDHDWCLRRVIEIVLREGLSFVQGAYRSIGRKDSALRFLGTTANAFLASPVFLYLAQKVKERS